MHSTNKANSFSQPNLLFVLYAVGIGDHTATDMYKDAEIALRNLADAEDRLQVLKDYYLTETNGH